MLNLHCNKNGEKERKKNIKQNYAKKTEIRTQEVVSTTLWRPMQLTDKNN